MKCPCRLRAKPWVTQSCASFVAGHAATISLLSPAQAGSGAPRHVVETLGSSHCWMTPTAPFAQREDSDGPAPISQVPDPSRDHFVWSMATPPKLFPLGPESGSTIDTCVLPTPGGPSSMTT